MNTSKYSKYIFMRNNNEKLFCLVTPRDFYFDNMKIGNFHIIIGNITILMISYIDRYMHVHMYRYIDSQKR